jgi:deoxyribonuclease V
MNLKDALKVQRTLAPKVKLEWKKGKVNLIAGVDASYKSKKIIGAISVFSFPHMELVEERIVARDIHFPYLPSFLSFRELPVFIEVFKLLKNIPDLIFVDGNGIAHPRRFGLASHLGVALNIPAIGCAKNPYYLVKEPSLKRGCYSLMRNEKGEIVGAALRTRDRIKPVYVSPGHLITLKKSIEFVLKSSIFRLPEPLREAHRLSSKFKF